MNNQLKSELLVSKMIEAINNINKKQSTEQSHVFDLYKAIAISYNKLIKRDFKEKFDFDLFSKRRQMLLEINKSELMSLSNILDDTSSSDNYFQIKGSLAMMINSLREQYNLIHLESM